MLVGSTQKNTCDADWSYGRTMPSSATGSPSSGLIQRDSPPTGVRPLGTSSVTWRQPVAAWPVNVTLRSTTTKSEALIGLGGSIERVIVRSGSALKALG